MPSAMLKWLREERDEVVIVVVLEDVANPGSVVVAVLGEDEPIQQVSVRWCPMLQSLVGSWKHQGEPREHLSSE